MTIGSDIAASGPFFPNGVTTAFPFEIDVGSASDISVLWISADGSEAVISPGAYGVTISESDPGGTVTFAVAPTIPKAGDELWIVLDPEFEQQDRYSDEGPFNQSLLEGSLDSNARLSIWLKARVDRALRVPFGDTIGALPLTDARANKFLAFDAGGNPSVSSGTGADAGLRGDLAATGGAAFIGKAGGGTVQDGLNARVAYVPTRTAMKALNTSRFGTVVLTEAGRGGTFILHSGSAPADTLEGVYIASNTAGFYWEREWDGVHGRPEWFGAIPNSSADAAGNLTAINACIALCPVTQFGNTDYWVNGRVNVQTPYRTIQGVRGDGYNLGTGTRIISLDNTVPVVRFGPDSQPASLAAHMRGIVARDLTFFHINSYVGPTSGNEAQAVPTIDRRWLIKAVFERLNAWEPLIGVYSRGLVQCYTSNCKVLRTAVRVASGTDFCWANFIDGNPPATGLPGNPSIYEQTFAAEFNPSLAVDKVAILCSADFSDVFIEGAEASNANSGLRLLGSGTKAQINCHIRDCIFDQCSGTALDIQGLAAGSCVNIEGGYYQALDTALAVIHARGTNGTVNIVDGCQIVGGESGDMIGIYAQGQQQINIAAGVTILECPRPIILEGVTGAQLLCSVQNDSVGDGTQPIVATSASDGVRIAIQARGKNTAFARGIDLVGTSNTRVSIDPTLIDRNIISGGAANLIFADPFGTPVAITAPGYFTSAGASGTSGAGIHVTGITA